MAMAFIQPCSDKSGSPPSARSCPCISKGFERGDWQVVVSASGYVGNVFTKGNDIVVVPRDSAGAKEVDEKSTRDQTVQRQKYALQDYGGYGESRSCSGRRLYLRTWGELRGVESLAYARSGRKLFVASLEMHCPSLNSAFLSHSADTPGATSRKSPSKSI